MPAKPSSDEIEFARLYVEQLGEIIDKASDAIVNSLQKSQQRKMEWLRAVSDELQDFPSDSLEQSSSKNPFLTYVYLMRHKNGKTKIGRSKYPQARERTLQSEDPELEMILCFECHEKIEARMHKIFADLRVRGEWFSLEQRHIDWIRLIFVGESKGGIDMLAEKSTCNG